MLSWKLIFPGNLQSFASLPKQYNSSFFFFFKDECVFLEPSELGQRLVYSVLQAVILKQAMKHIPELSPVTYLSYIS